MRPLGMTGRLAAGLGAACLAVLPAAAAPKDPCALFQSDKAVFGETTLAEVAGAGSRNWIAWPPTAFDQLGGCAWSSTKADGLEAVYAVAMVTENEFSTLLGGRFSEDWPQRIAIGDEAYITKDAATDVQLVILSDGLAIDIIVSANDPDLARAAAIKIGERAVAVWR